MSFEEQRNPTGHRRAHHEHLHGSACGKRGDANEPPVGSAHACDVVGASARRILRDRARYGRRDAFRDGGGVDGPEHPIPGLLRLGLNHCRRRVQRLCLLPSLVDDNFPLQRPLDSLPPPSERREGETLYPLWIPHPAGVDHPSLPPHVLLHRSFHPPFRELSI